jgi:hypothetical protein
MKERVRRVRREAGPLGHTYGQFLALGFDPRAGVGRLRRSKHLAMRILTQDVRTAAAGLD